MVPGLPFSWGYVGSLCILAYAYSFSRIDYLWALVVGVGTAAIYTAVAVEEGTRGVPLLYANAFILVFIVLGVATAYMLERSSRQLFAQGEELATERERADALLRNTFPEPVIDRLKSGEGRVADAIDAVSVLFADLVGFTGRAATLSPEELVALLDDLFGRLDEIVAAHGLEKIKTIGDAYMAVGGAPLPLRDHAGAAADAALAMHALAGARTWPGGEPMRLRIGIASGPAVAGVIGRERFAYDLWGETVNLASRLQVQAEPGETLIAAATAALLDARYGVGDERIVDLKGKGPTAVRTLRGRR
jgi:class 3 adenylate cyclase